MTKPVYMIITVAILLIIVIIIFIKKSKNDDSIPAPMVFSTPGVLSSTQFTKIDNDDRAVPIKNRSPIIVLPGLCGTPLYIDKVNQERMDNVCKKHEKFKEGERLWVINSGMEECFSKALKGKLNDDNVWTRPYLKVKFGDYDESEYPLNYYGKGNFYPNTHMMGGLTPPGISVAHYLKYFAEFFERRGYERGIDLFALPYDWSRIPYGNIEDISSYNDNNRNPIGNLMVELFVMILAIKERYKNPKDFKKIVLIGHSLGGFLIPVLINMLRNVEGKTVPFDKITIQVPVNFVDDHINLLITMGGAFDGCSKTIRGMISGANPSPFISDYKSIPLFRTLPGPLATVSILKSSFMFNHIVYLKGQPTLTPTDNAEDIINFIENLPGEYTSDAANILGQLMNAKTLAFTDPKLKSLIIYGDELSTEAEFKYQENYDKSPDIFYGLGDGTVPLKSLMVPLLGASFNYKDKQYRLNKWQDAESFIVKGPLGEHFNIINIKNDSWYKIDQEIRKL